MRFSTAPGELTRDSIPSFRGMALKLVGVPGEKTIPEDKDALTQDFLLVNHPTIPTGTVDQYLRGMKLMSVAGKEPEPVQKAMAKGTQAINAVASAVGVEVIGPAGQGKKETGILDQTFTSMAAIRYGGYVAKISAAPITPALTTEEQRHPTIHGDAGLRDVVRDFFQKQGAEYEIRVQLCTDLEIMPVEDGGIRWARGREPLTGVAKLVIPQQDSYSDARRIYGDDTLTFNPWHCIPSTGPWATSSASAARSTTTRRGSGMRGTRRRSGSRRASTSCRTDDRSAAGTDRSHRRRIFMPIVQTPVAELEYVERGAGTPVPVSARVS